jgi:hypothetical protein
MEWGPDARVLTVQPAAPELTGTAEQPGMEVPPSVKLTVPPLGAGDTVSVKATGCPNTDGLGTAPSAELVRVPTARLADAVFPVPAFVADTAPVVLV